MEIKIYEKYTGCLCCLYTKDMNPNVTETSDYINLTYTEEGERRANRFPKLSYKYEKIEEGDQ